MEKVILGKNTATDEQMAVYTNPEFWDGYTLGIDGPPTTETPINNSFTNVIRASQYLGTAFFSLRRHLKQDNSFPAHSLHEGQTFDANNYSQGTVVSYSEERLMLRKTAGNTEAPAESLPLPEKQKITPNLGHLVTNSRVAISPSFRHCIDANWGVVVSERHSNVLYSIHDLFVAKTDRSRILPLFWPMLPVEFPIGKVFGDTRDPKRAGKPSVTCFKRVNNLNVYLPGQPKRRRATLPLGETAIGELPSY